MANGNDEGAGAGRWAVGDGGRRMKEGQFRFSFNAVTMSYPTLLRGSPRGAQRVAILTTPTQARSR